MSGDHRRSVSGKSVAAFLFLPQFHLSYRQLSFVMPVLVRTLAVMFEQAGLIAPNHPATRYGTEGVRKIGVRGLLGEAWMTLRTNPNVTLYQWGMFSSVVLMIVFMIAGIISFVMNLVFSTAQAQIFSHPAGIDTGLGNVPTATPGILFDTQNFAEGGRTDFAIGVLDRVLRQGALGQGGAMQNALRGLMEVYNTGMLVIAGLLVFWAIISIVVDTARTGQLGGGRHNMVWAPIRIVFGLALLIPLGSTGFSSGQFMVMKLAEWGSNFGSRGWATYVDSVVGESLLIEPKLENPQSLVIDFVRLYVCTIAYNGAQNQAMGGNLTYQEAVQPLSLVPGKGLSNEGGRGQPERVYGFTDRTGASICGQVSSENPDSRAITRALNSDDKTLAEFRKRMANYKFEALGGSRGISGQARQFACAFVGGYFHETKSRAHPLVAPDAPDVLCLPEMLQEGVCGTDHGNAPTGECINQMTENFLAFMKERSDSARQLMVNYVQDDSENGFQNRIARQGWAGMGIWYHELTRVNATVAKSMDYTVSITRPTVAASDECSAVGSFFSGINPFAPGERCRRNESKAKAAEVLVNYDRWWSYVSTAYESDQGGFEDRSTDVRLTREAQVSTTAFGWDEIKSLIDTTGNKAFNYILSWIFPGEGFFLFSLGDYGSDKYPMAELAGVGSALLTAALKAGSFGVAISVIGSFATMGGWAATVAGVFMPFVFAVIIPALMLLYWIPILPWVRVVFSVITWIVSVFEAVMMVPVVALSHLSTEGEGIAGGAKTAYILWLNILLRPILTVIGFVGSILIFNTMVLYMNDTMQKTIVNAGMQSDAIERIIYTIVYVGMVYTMANSSFKLIDTMPNALSRWMGGSADVSFEDNNTDGFIAAAGNYAVGAGNTLSRGSAEAGAGLRKWYDKRKADKEGEKEKED